MIKDINKIINLSSNEKEKILKDPVFRENLFKLDNHYDFINLVRSLNDDLKFLLDDDFISYLKRDFRKIDKLAAIMSINSDISKNFIVKEDVLNLIIECINNFKKYLKQQDDSFGFEFLSYIMKNNLEIGLLSNLNKDVQMKLIRNNIGRIKSSELSLDNIDMLDNDAIAFLLNDMYFVSKLKEIGISIFITLSKKGVTFPINIQYDKDIIDNVAGIKDINYFNKILSYLDDNYYLKENLILSRRKKYLEYFNNIDYTLGIFSEYKPVLEGKAKFPEQILNDKMTEYRYYKNGKLSFLRELTITKMLEMTVDTFYQDITYNFLKNVEAIVNYVNLYASSIVPKGRLSIYNKFLNYYDLEMSERIDLFNYLNSNSKNNLSEFYDDFNNIKNKTNLDIKNSLSKLEKIEKVKEIDGINIYELNGEPFKFMITCTDTLRNSYKEDKKIWYDVKGVETGSLSLISDKNIVTFKDPDDYVILGFSDYDINDIIITYPTDAYTDNMGSSKVRKFYSPDDLIKETKVYNEIQITEKYHKLKPSYILCYDTIKPGDINASKTLGNIPLVVLNTKKYNCNVDYTIYDDSYVNYHDIPEFMNYRKR